MIINPVKRAYLALESWFNLSFGSDWNPLYHLGTLSFFLFWVILVSGIYLGTTFVNGEECHYMAFRTDVADWQIWVRSGDEALPMKYVVTSKWTTGSPQYSVRFRNWDTSPSLAANRFVFTPSGADRKLETIPVNEVGEFNLDEAQQ